MEETGKKISQFDPLASLELGDIFVVVENSGILTTKKVTFESIVSAVFAELFLDEDDFASNSNQKGATQQSIKAFVEANKTELLNESNMASNSNTKGATQASIVSFVQNGSITLTNKTIDASNNTLQNLLATMFATGQFLRLHDNSANTKMATGNVPIALASQQENFATVTFPVGAFANPPRVFLSVRTTTVNPISRYNLNPYSITSAGCNVEVRYLPGSTTDSLTFDYLAIGT